MILNVMHILPWFQVRNDFNIWPAFIWRFFLENKKSAGCLLKTKWQMKICIFTGIQIFSSIIIMFFFFISHFVFIRQQAELFFPPKICQMRAGQNNKYEITNPLSISTWFLKYIPYFPKVTVHKCAETIQGRKLYEEIR